ncbi:MAG: hypothetical protein WC759_01090 [Candidatus Micrarchaeia archaeon]|jgi:hypothetical protein
MLGKVFLLMVFALAAIAVVSFYILPEAGCLISKCMDEKNSIAFVQTLDAYRLMVDKYGEPACAYSGDTHDGDVTCFYEGRSFTYVLSSQGNIELMNGRMMCGDRVIDLECGYGGAMMFINNCFLKTIKENPC